MTEREISVSALIFSVLALSLTLMQADFSAPTDDPATAAVPRDVRNTENQYADVSASEPSLPVLQGYTPAPLDAPAQSAPSQVEVPTIDPIKTGITPVRP